MRNQVHQKNILLDSICMISSLQQNDLCAHCWLRGRVFGPRSGASDAPELIHVYFLGLAKKI